jgi:hypothetical protein
MGSYDYNGLGECSPDVTQAKINGDGTATLSFTIPAGCSAQHWDIKTFHVPDPANWMKDQVETDNQSGDFTPGINYVLTLKTVPGACQLDMWQSPLTQIYAGDTSEACAPPTALVPAAEPTPTTITAPVPEAPPAVAPVPLPEVQAVPGPTPRVEASTVALVSYQPALPATGPVLPPELTGTVALALLVLGCASIRLAKRLGLS